MSAVMRRTTRMLTPQQVTQRLGIDKSTLSRWVAAGKITPAYTAEGPNGVRLYDEADVERIAAERAAS